MCFTLYHFRAIILSDTFDSQKDKNLKKDSAIAENLHRNKLLHLPDSNRFKVVIKVSGLFNGEDSVGIK